MPVIPAVRPVLDRPDLVTAVVTQLPTDPATQQEVADSLVAGWHDATWPDGLLARTVFTSTDGTMIITYGQWAARDAEDAGTPYEMYVSVRGGAIPDPPPVTGAYPGAFFATPNHDAARKWVDDLLTAEVANEGERREYPGALAAHFHVAVDGSGVFLLSEWTSEEEAVEHIAEVIEPILVQLGTPDAGLRYRHHATLDAKDVRPDSTAAPGFPVASRGCPMDPAPLLTEFREGPSVARVRIWDGSEPWLITRHAEARAALRDSRLSSDVRRPGFPFLSAAQKEAIGDSLLTFIRMDPPEHTRQRRMLTHEFLVKRMARIRPEVDALVDSLIDDLVAAGPPADLMALVAQPLPATITCRMLGVPREDEEFFQRNSQRVQDIAATPQDVATALGDLAARLDRLTTTKAADPGDDLISRLVVEQEQPGHLSRQDVVGMALNLLIAGHETTANMIGLGVLGLHEHGQWDVLVRQPELVPSAVEELLRHQSIVPYGLPRVAVADIEIGDVTIKAGEGVLVQVAAANRDPRVFADPDRIDVRREARHHLGFGFGVHQCLGQPLARVELQSVLAGLLRRLPNLKLPYSSAELDFKHEMNVYGLFTLPVEW